MLHFAYRWKYVLNLNFTEHLLNKSKKAVHTNKSKI